MDATSIGPYLTTQIVLGKQSGRNAFRPACRGWVSKLEEQALNRAFLTVQGTGG